MLEPGKEKAILVLLGAWGWLGQECTVSSPCRTWVGGAGLSLGLGLALPCPLCCASLQKMDRNKDGVVTIEEFLESCQKVKPPAALLWCPRAPLSPHCPPGRQGVNARLPGQGWGSALGTVSMPASLCR